MNKNVASQKVTLLVIDSAANTPKTGDAANLTAYVSKDDGAVTVLGDTTATELDATNAPGLYAFDLTQAETNADKLLFSGKSATSGIKVIPLLVYTRPPNASALSIDGSGRVDVAKIAGTSQTARDVGASVLLSPGTGTGQLDFTAGVVKANATQLLGTAWLTPAVAGTPDVNAKQVGGTAQTGLDIGGNWTAARAAHLDADISSRMATYTQPTGFLAATFPATVASPTNITSAAGCAVSSIGANVITAASIAADADAELAAAVWDLATAGHTTTGTFGAAMNAAGSAGDPWATSLPGAYGAGTAGNILGNNLNATVSSRSTYAGADTAGTTTLLSRVTGAVLLASGYTAPDNAGIASVVAKLPANAIADETLVIAATNSILSAVGSPMQAGAHVQLATAQDQYAPAKAGDAMTLAAGSIASATFAAGATIPRCTLVDTTTANTDMLTAAGVRGAVGLAAADLDAQLAAKQATFTSATGVTFPTNLGSMAIDANGRVKIQSGVTKNTALAGFEFLMVDSSDHVTGKTGLTITGMRSLDGAAFGSCANAVTEVGNGVYAIDLAAGDLNGNVVALKFAGTGADTRIIEILTTP